MTTDDDVAWAADVVGSDVVARRVLTGGWTSTILALTHADGRDTVLRVIDREPWSRHRAALTTRERDTQAFLASTVVPAPRTLALDAEHGRHLMTLLPGATDLGRTSNEDVRALAETLATIHELSPADPPRTYQSWAWEAKYVVPAWADEPAVWTDCFALLRTEPPGYEPTFLHRDYRPRNVLWDADPSGGISGVVDWVETSTGPAWLDVAHCATSLALVAGPERAEAFRASYVARTGRVREPYWEVMDAVGLIPPPGVEGMVTDPVEQRRLEGVLADALAALTAMAALDGLSARRRP